VPSALDVLLAAVVGSAVWGSLGYALALRLFADRALQVGVAPALGWAIHNTFAIPVLMALGFTRLAVAGLAVLTLAAAAAIRPRGRLAAAGPSARVPAWAFVLAALIALLPSATLMPKHVPDGVIVAGAIYDHLKIAITDEIARGNLPPLNPFYAEAGHPESLTYYWGWYASAAQLSLLPGVGGWAADVALTWFTAFASLTLMMGLAVWFCGRASAAGWAGALSLAFNLRPILPLLLGEGAAANLLSPHSGLGTWIAQMPWVPQHVAAASSAVVAAFLLPRLETRLLPAPVLGLALAASVGSSTYVGFVAVVAASVAGLVLLARARARLRFFGGAALAAVVAAAFALPFILQQVAAVAALPDPAVVFRPFPVLGSIVPEEHRAALDYAAYWLLLFLIEWPAIYLLGFLGAAWALMSRSADGDRRPAAIAIAILALSGLATTAFLASVIGNNDLGWRATLPPVLALTVFAAAGLADWFRGRTIRTVGIVLFAFGLPAGVAYIRGLAAGFEQRSAAAFAASPELWEAVRRHAGPDDRVANNPLYLGEVTPWPGNITWALFSDRRSCFAIWESAVVYAGRPREVVNEVAKLFNRAFAGTASPADIEALALKHDCDVILIVPTDGAWHNDLFAASPHFRLAEATDRWRIYVSAHRTQSVAVATSRR